MITRIQYSGHVPHDLLFRCHMLTHKSDDMRLVEEMVSSCDHILNYTFISPVVLFVGFPSHHFM